MKGITTYLILQQVHVSIKHPNVYSQQALLRVPPQAPWMCNTAQIINFTVTGSSGLVLLGMWNSSNDSSGQDQKTVTVKFVTNRVVDI